MLPKLPAPRHKWLIMFDMYGKVSARVSTGKTPSQELSEEYTKDMQEKMGDRILTYDHSAGMNYAHILDDVIVGSCLQTPDDADR